MRSSTVSFVLVTLALACRPPLVSAEDGENDELDELGDGSSGDTTTGGDTLAGSDDTTGDVCGEVWLIPEFIPSNLLVLVDASSSMALESWDDDGDPLTPEVTRWSSARRLVEQLVDELDATTNLGVQRFPSKSACPNASLASANCSDADACLVDAAPEVALGLGQGPAIVASLPDSDADAIEIAGGTPASAAFVSALDHLSSDDTFSAILLITDGAANCGEGLSLPESFETFDSSLATVVSDAFQFDSIPTYVVGIDVGIGLGVAGPDSPVVDAFDALNDVALAGGIPHKLGMDPQKFYGPGDLQALLDNFRPYERDTDCTIDLSQTPAGVPSPELVPFVEVEVDGVGVPHVDACETEAGWVWIVEGEILTLCGAPCEAFHDTAAVHVIYWCSESP